MAKKSEYKYVNELNPFGFHEVEVDIDQIKKHPSNPRKITKRNQIELKQSMDKFGLIDRPILNADFTTIAGHQRIDLLIQKEIKRVKVMMPEIELNEAQVIELMLRHNKNTGEWDFEKLALISTDQLIEAGWDHSELDKIVEEGREEHEVENTEAEFPLTPRMSEKYSYVLVMVENDIEKANLETVLQLEPMKDYKSSKVGLGRVITFDRFKKCMDDYAAEKNSGGKK